MKILIACEESQRVCVEFRKLGHEAYSCDIMDCSGGHPEWHIKGDVLKILNPSCHQVLEGGTPTNDCSQKGVVKEWKGITFHTTDGKLHLIEGKWDMIIAFPPCTHLCVSGARHFEKKRADGRQREGVEFFCKFLSADCDRIVIENPVGIISGKYIREHFPDLAEKYGLPKEPTQIIHPWMFGDNYSKSTCLWIIGDVNPLIPLVTEQPELEWFEWVDGKTGKKKRQPKWFADAWKLPPDERAKVRSKTFLGVAKAMAEQWG